MGGTSIVHLEKKAGRKDRLILPPRESRLSFGREANLHVNSGGVGTDRRGGMFEQTAQRLSLAFRTPWALADSHRQSGGSSAAGKSGSVVFIEWIFAARLALGIEQAIGNVEEDVCQFILQITQRAQQEGGENDAACNQRGQLRWMDTDQHGWERFDFTPRRSRIQ